MEGDGTATPAAATWPRQTLSQRRRFRRTGCALPLAAALLALDLSSKVWARAQLSPVGRGHSVVSFALVRNHGAALGIGTGHPGMVGAVEVLAVMVVVWWLWSASSACQRACAAVVLGGAAGNLFDRLRHGAVTDWIHVAPYPPYFNVADLAIRGGLAAAAVLALCRYSDRDNLHGRSVESIRSASVGTRPAPQFSDHCKDWTQPAERRNLIAMTVSTAIEDEQPIGPSVCWCCGVVDEPARLVHLGNHPEVVVCIRCAHTVSKWAWELEDQARTGIAVRARDSFRRLRKTVVRHGWHNNKFLGRGLRWIGRFTP